MLEPIFSVKTTMEKEDYKKFLYIAIFCKNKLLVPVIILLTIIGSLIINYSNLLAIILTWILLFVLSIASLCFMVVTKNKQRLKSNKAGEFGSFIVWKYYDEKIIMENEVFHATEMRYDQIYQLLESKDYFIFYLTKNQASLVRKRDFKQVSDFKEFIISKFENNYKYIKFI
ncbi:YcxB family protein [Anaerosacchariphilus polymeriproducens]|uniref:YcxB family protein n=1 Tax=Anaerosacchariphilus polymeriproducens TaxID=1812858 RepID=A0A371AXV0_9FIRM|nr:YcxB family protein [Anaerosacchariphilus polymeriproducens]RDU24396.1 YcxB family protein [Anaerosacchariphilus polymeriproducens]